MIPLKHPPLSAITAMLPVVWNNESCFFVCRYDLQTHLVHVGLLWQPRRLIWMPLASHRSSSNQAGNRIVACQNLLQLLTLTTSVGWQRLHIAFQFAGGQAFLALLYVPKRAINHNAIQTHSIEYGIIYPKLHFDLQNISNLAYRHMHRIVQSENMICYTTVINNVILILQVPIPCGERNQQFRAMKWIIESCRDKERNVHMENKLAWELLDAYKNEVNYSAFNLVVVQYSIWIDEHCSTLDVDCCHIS